MHNKPETNGSDPEKYSMQHELAAIRWNPSVEANELKKENLDHSERQGVRVPLATPIETAHSPNTSVEQDLMAVVSLGENVAIGVVRGRETDGNQVYYASLMNNGRYPTGNDDRAKLLEVVRPGIPVTITREMIEQLTDIKEIARGVSRTHCTIEISDGVLAVVDEASSNGTTVFTNISEKKQRQFGDVSQWSQRSRETKELIKAEMDARRQEKPVGWAGLL